MLLWHVLCQTPWLQAEIYENKCDDNVISKVCNHEGNGINNVVHTRPMASCSSVVTLIAWGISSCSTCSNKSLKIWGSGKEEWDISVCIHRKRGKGIPNKMAWLVFQGIKNTTITGGIAIE
jgi:hypothetical protein